jgi:hypothetical protein
MHTLPEQWLTLFPVCHARESGAPCQSAQSVCDWAADSLTRQAEGIIRKLPQMMDSISMRQAQELEECKALLSKEKINHSAARQVGGHHANTVLNNFQ